MSKKLTILFIPNNGVGHVNASIGIATALARQGHRVIFVVRQLWASMITYHGLEVSLIDDPVNNDLGNEMTSKVMQTEILSADMSTGLSPSDKLMKMADIWKTKVDEQIELDGLLERIIPSIEPDLIVMDQLLALPYVQALGIPYVWVCSGNPLNLLDDPRTPPSFSGRYI